MDSDFYRDKNKQTIENYSALLRKLGRGDEASAVELLGKVTDSRGCSAAIIGYARVLQSAGRKAEAEAIAKEYPNYKIFSGESNAPAAPGAVAKP
jgi:hypothetical protein